ncbi:MAG: DUF1501 domain-containing protein [Proteobacteria bacterium]|nr:DUF1501 domain-containing protein [Pseudomonadota bacterium]
MMNRRTVLKGLVAGGLGLPALSSSLTWFVRTGQAQSISPARTLVVVFLRGGCDGLNVCVPYGDPAYYDLRPTIAIAPPDPADLASALDLDGFFGLHPGLGAIKRFYDDGRLALFPAVHYPQPSRSHFDSQHFIESGARRKDLEGWLNRHLASTSRPERMRAVGFGKSLPQSLRGSVVVSSIDNLASFRVPGNQSERDNLLAALQTVYREQPSDRPHRAAMREVGEQLIGDLDAVAGIDADRYPPDNGAVYPTRSFGRHLQQTAQLIKAGLGLEIATVDLGGWDTHEGQGGGQVGSRHRHMLERLASGLNAFATDLGDRMDDVLVIVCTEFGRTVRENGSRGTDHGMASTWLALGGQVDGGQIYGSWPTLETGNLVAGRFLPYTIDYRDIFATVAAGFLGNSDIDYLFPEYAFSPTKFLRHES